MAREQRLHRPPHGHLPQVQRLAQLPGSGRERLDLGFDAAEIAALEQVDDEPRVALERELGVRGLGRRAQKPRRVDQPLIEMVRVPVGAPPRGGRQRRGERIVELGRDLRRLRAQSRHPVAFGRSSRALRTSATEA